VKNRRSLRRTSTVLAAAALAVGAVATAQASTPTETTQTMGTVTFIADGDTPYVNSNSVRLIGVQAPEIHHPGGPPAQCHAGAAEAELKKLISGKRIQLRSMYASSSNLGRPLRSAFVKQNGAWTNVQREMLKGGWVFWFNQNVETQHNYDYHVLTMKAAAAHKRLWNTSYCGSGPYQSANLKVYAHYHANGSDKNNINDEWIEIDNDNPSGTVHIGGWRLRDSSLAMFTFPSHAQIEAGKFVRVHVGKGTNVNDATTRKFYWNQTAPVFGEVSKKTGEGDMAILLDPDGDYRAWTDFPCVVSCSDPLIGHLQITSWDAGAGGDREWIKLRSVNTTSRIHLDHYQLRSWPWNYVFRPHTYLDPGETLKVFTGKGSNPSRLVQYMGESSTGILANGGDVIDVSNMRDVQITCTSWGGVSCKYDY